MLVTILFYAFATVLVAAALGVILSRNPVHSALSLVLCFMTSAALWLLIEAEFLAIVLVLVYVGAVMVLFLFVVMMLDVKVETLRSGFTRHAWLGWVTVGVIIAEIASVFATRSLGIDVTKGAAPLPADYSNTQALGSVMYTQYVYPFELAAVLLLVAIIAAIALTMRHRAGLKAQDISRQVSVRARDRVRIVKIQPLPEVVAADSLAGGAPLAPGPHGMAPTPGTTIGAAGATGPGTGTPAGAATHQSSGGGAA